MMMMMMIFFECSAVQCKTAFDLVWFPLVRFPDPPYGVGRENEPPRSWEKNFGAT